MPELPVTRFPNWYPDPTGRTHQRYFDGGQWTEHVFTNGRQGVDPLESKAVEAARPPLASPPVGPQPVRVVPLDRDPGAGDLRTARVLLVQSGADGGEQGIFDQRSHQMGNVRMVRPRSARVARALVSGEPESSCRVEIRDAGGEMLLTVARPTRPMKVRLHVRDGTGAELGTIVRQQALTRVRYSLRIGDEQVGMIDADHWDSWRIGITAADGSELAHVTRTWEVLAGTRFTPADTYVVQLADGIARPVRGLVLATALTIDGVLRPAVSGAA